MKTNDDDGGKSGKSNRGDNAVTQFRTFDSNENQIAFFGMLRKDNDRHLDALAEDIEEEEKKSEHSDDAQSWADCEITSNFAFDRFASLGAYGYSNGLIKLVRVSKVKDEIVSNIANK